VCGLQAHQQDIPILKNEKSILKIMSAHFIVTHIVKNCKKNALSIRKFLLFFKIQEQKIVSGGNQNQKKYAFY